MTHHSRTHSQSQRLYSTPPEKTLYGKTDLISGNKFAQFENEDPTHSAGFRTRAHSKFSNAVPKVEEGGGVVQRSPAGITELPVPDSAIQYLVWVPLVPLVPYSPFIFSPFISLSTFIYHTISVGIGSAPPSRRRNHYLGSVQARLPH